VTKRASVVTRHVPQDKLKDESLPRRLANEIHLDVRVEESAFPSDHPEVRARCDKVCHALLRMQILFNGVISGAAIALLAVAFQLVYLPTRVFFIGLAGLYAVAPYFVLATQKAGMHLVVGGASAVLAVVGLALLCEWLNHAPLTRKGASDGAHLISSLGVYILLVQIVAMIWGSDTKTLRVGIDSTVRLGGSVLTRSQIVIAGLATALLFGFWMLLRSTNIGLRLRALADNPMQFALFGYNIGTHRLVAFGFAGIFAAASSLLTAYDTGFDPYMGLHAVLLAVVAVIIGGRYSFAGPAIGGLFLGLIRAQVVWHLSARWQEAVTFVILALFLLVRPQGLFGHQTRVEASA
jgi:branched-chain amino acid transport system permease protein